MNRTLMTSLAAVMFAASTQAAPLPAELSVGTPDEPWDFPADNWSFYHPDYDAQSADDPVGDFALTFKLTVDGVRHELPPYDTAFHTRYVNPAVLFFHSGVEFRRGDGAEGFYRVLFSTVTHEVALYKEGGGFVAVADAGIEAGRSHEVAITAAANRITVTVDGVPKIDYLDRRGFSPGGRLSFLALHSRTTFRDAAVAPIADAKPVQVPAHAPAFSAREWMGWLWLFDGQEPVARIMRYDVGNHRNAPNDVLGPYRYFGVSDAKLVPGVEPATPFQLDWDCSLAGVSSAQPRKLDPFEARPNADGTQVDVSWRIVDGSGGQLSRGTMAVSYDAELDSYVFDVQSTKTLREPLEGDNVQFADPWPYFASGPATEISTPWKRKYRWGVFRAEDGSLHKTPMNHHWWADSRIQSGGFYAFTLSPDVNPVFEMHSEAGMPQTVGLCNWGFDLHLQYRIPEDKRPLPAGTELPVRMRVYSFPHDKAKALLDEAVFPAEWYAGLEKTIAPAQTGSVTQRFGPDQWVKAVEPFDAWVWLGVALEQWDQQVGRDDAYSLKFTPGQQVRARIGEGSYYGIMKAPEYEFSCHVRTAGVAEGGFRIGIKAFGATEIVWSEPVKGDADWTRVALRTPGNHLVGADLYMELQGQGTAWVDDVRFAEPNE